MEEKSNQYFEEISKFIFTSRYSRYSENLKRRETWEESIDRLQKMHLKKFNFLNKEDKDKIKECFNLVKQKKIVPSMRSLQFGGKAIEAHQARMFNCSVRHVDSLRSFSELFYLLLCGCGIGIGLSKVFLNRLPDLVGAENKNGTIIAYVIEDSIEGWADSIEALLNCYFKNTPYTGRKIVFDYSKIRKKGDALKTGGGKAPGYKGLKEAHIKIKNLLDHIIEYKQQKRLKSVDAYDILMHCSDAVLSGGIRRSACSVMFDLNDEEMMVSKSNFKVDRIYSFHLSHEEVIGGRTTKYYEGKILFEKQKIEVVIDEYALDKLKKESLISWIHIYPHRARSNNSVLLLRDQILQSEFEKIVETTKQYGEPGFVFANHPHTLFNPCFEISFIPVTNDGVCGVQFCNLTSLNGKEIKSIENFRKYVEAYVILGTLQAAYTNFPYLSNAAQQLTEEESLLGCSITGIMDSPDILLNQDYQKEMANLTKKVNKEWAEKIKINPSARITCIKPEGTSSLILGCASGIHPHHARKYFRRVQCNKEDNVYKFFKEKNPELCEESVWSANKTDDVVTFPIVVSEGALIKKDLSAVKHLKIIKNTQKNWVKEGTTEFNKKPIEHNVSCTVIVKSEEWSDVIDYLYKNRNFFTAVALLPSTGDKDYPQAPMEEVLTEDDEKRWEKITSSFKPVDYTTLLEKDDNTDLIREAVCAGGACEIIKL